MTKIDTSQTFFDPDGFALNVPDRQGELTPLTLRRVLNDALYVPQRGDETMNGDDKAKLYALGQRINTPAAEVDMRAEDIAKLKARVGTSHYGALVVGQALLMLDPPASATLTAIAGGKGDTKDEDG